MLQNAHNVQHTATENCEPNLNGTTWGGELVRLWDGGLKKNFFSSAKKNVMTT